MVRRHLPLIAGLLVLAGGVFWVQSQAFAESKAERELRQAVEKGAALYKKSWSTGAKTCAACHTRGPNRLTAARANAYPKYDKAMKKVVTLQQKLNQMIKSKSKGKVLALGSEELNALEAYLKTLK